MFKGDHSNAASFDLYLDKFVNEKLDKSEDQTFRIRHSLLIADNNMKDLNCTQNMNFIDFHSLMKDRSLDALLFVYNSSLFYDKQREASQMFNYLCQFAMVRMNLTSLLFASYDYGGNRLPAELSIHQKQSNYSIYLKKAFQSRGPMLLWPEEPSSTIEDLLSFALKNIDLKYTPNPEGLDFTEEDSKHFKFKEKIFQLVPPSDPDL